MKYYQIKPTFAFSILVVTTLLLSSQPAQAGETRFICGKDKGIPTTLAKTKRGFVPVIQWRSAYFSESGWTPEARCQKVSNLFEKYYREGTLNYLTTGRDYKTRQNVVCVAPSANAKCTGVLFTLKKESNPGQTLKKLMNLRVRATRTPLTETSIRIYVNMDEFLNNQPTLPSNSSDPANPPSSQTTSENFW